MTALVFILLLSLLVVIHELGHFFAARRAGVKVKEFGFGYPPRVWKLFRWEGTLFSFNAIPFGGFVKLEGEDYDGAPAEQAPIDAFYTKSAWARFFVVVAGPLANILFGVAAFSLVFGLFGIPRFLDGQPRIEMVSPDSPAQHAGINPDYEVRGFIEDGELRQTATVNEVVAYVQENQGRAVTIALSGPCEGLTCPDEVTEKTLHVRTPEETPAGQGSIGLVFADFILEKGHWYQQIPRGIVYGIQNAFLLSVAILRALGGLVTQLVVGRLPSDLAGPVGIVHQASESRLLSQGWGPLLEFTGLLSINLGVMNLLPIPALDGGRILFIALERLLGKRRIQSVEGYIHYGGFIVLLGLIALVSIRDITAVLGG